MKKFHITRSMIQGILIIIVGTLFVGVLLSNIYNRSAVQHQYSNSNAKLEVAAQRLEDYQTEAQQNDEIYSEFSSGRASILAYYCDNNPEETNLSWLISDCGIDEYYLTNAKGELVSNQGNVWPEHHEALLDLKNGQDGVVIGDEKYFSASLLNGGYLIIGRSNTSQKASQDELTSPYDSLNTIVVGETGYIAEIDSTDHTILYDAEGSLIGEDASLYGMDVSSYEDGFAGKVKWKDGDYYIVTKQIDGAVLVAAVPWSEIENTDIGVEAVNLVLVALAMFFLLVYAEMIRKEASKKQFDKNDYKQIGKHLYLNRNIFSRMKNVVLMSVVAVFIMTYYINTLSPLSHQGVKSEDKVSAVSGLLDDNTDRINQLTQEYTDEYTSRAENIAVLIARDPSLMTNEAMAAFAQRGGLNAVYVFDEDGHASISNRTYLNYSLSTDSSDQSYAFWNVVNGYQDTLVQKAEESDIGTYGQYIGVGRKDGLGMVQIEISSDILNDRLKSTNLDYMLDHIAVANDGFMFAVNVDSSTFDYWTLRSKLTDRSVYDYGMTSSALNDSYEGFQTIDGTAYFVSGTLYGSDYVYCAVPLSLIYSSRLTSTLWATGISALVILFITFSLVFTREPATDASQDKSEEDHDKTFFAHRTSDGRKRLVQSATSRYETHISWDDHTPEQKLYALIGWTLIAAAVCIVFYIVFAGDSAPHSVLSYVLDQKWEKGVNLFSLTFIVLTMIEIVVVAWVIRKGLLLLLKKFGARSETVGHLLDSFIKYLSAIGGIFYCLNAIGLDSTSLLASASILGLMISFGAQSLIGDILAGIFIVFEGEFRVGDIVTVGEWRGTVVEIGIRTTKIMSGGHDIKIINNAEIKQVVNMTKQYSTAVVDIGIDYNESLERVESILKKELPHIKEHVPAIVEGPFYKGVTSLADSSVNIRILAECHEKDRIQVVRDLNRELKLCFDRNGISIPYPQIVVNPPTETKAPTNEDKKNANQFLHEQKEASSGITAAHEDK